MPKEYIPGEPVKACSVCTKCKDDRRMLTLASVTPHLLQLEELHLKSCKCDFGSMRHLMWVLAPLKSLKRFRLTGGAEWLFHCSKHALCEAVAHAPQLEVLDFTENEWAVRAETLSPLRQSKSLKVVNLDHSRLAWHSSLQVLPDDLQAKVQNLGPAKAPDDLLLFPEVIEAHVVL
jgi:hypothetical protein